jgi:hypothetical protein
MQDLQRKKAALEEALTNTSFALQHDEYTKPFVFKKPVTPPKSEFKNELLIDIIKKCEERDLGFDPDLFLQHVERAALDRFNEVVLSHLEGCSIKNLMTMRYEIELFMLKDRHEFHTKELEKVNKQLLEQVTGVSWESSDPAKDKIVGTIGPDKVTKIDSKKKKK